MKISCVIPIGPANVEHLREAYESAAGLFDEMIMVVAANQHFNHDVQRACLEGVRLIVDYGDSMSERINLGVAVARGDWITVLCSDDYVFREPQTQIRMVVESMLDSGAGGVAPDVVFGQVHEFSELDDGVHNVWPWHHTMRPAVLDRQNCVPIGAWFRKWYWWQVGGFQHVPYCDWVFWQDLYKQGARFQLIHEVPFYAHRNWSGSTGAGL